MATFFHGLQAYREHKTPLLQKATTALSGVEICCANLPIGAIGLRVVGKVCAVFDRDVWSEVTPAGSRTHSNSNALCLTNNSRTIYKYTDVYGMTRFSYAERVSLDKRLHRINSFRNGGHYESYGDNAYFQSPYTDWVNWYGEVHCHIIERSPYSYDFDYDEWLSAIENCDWATYGEAWLSECEVVSVWLRSDYMAKADKALRLARALRCKVEVVHPYQDASDDWEVLKDLL